MNWPIFFRLNEKHLTFHLRYKHSGTFAKRKYEELSYPQKSENVTPWQVTLLKMRAHHSQPSRENATPTSGTSNLVPRAFPFFKGKALGRDEVAAYPHLPLIRRYAAQRRNLHWSIRYFTRGFRVPVSLHLNQQIGSDLRLYWTIPLSTRAK